MAERRMLSRSVLDTDGFCDLPHPAQLLYIRLNLGADDDGFVTNPRGIMRAGGFREEDLEPLLKTGYLLAFDRDEGRVLLVRHWRNHNTIKKDRYHPSQYHSLLAGLWMDERRAYCLEAGEGRVPALAEAEEPARDPSGTDAEPEDRIGKNQERMSLNQDRSGVRVREGGANPGTLKLYRGVLQKAREEGSDLGVVYRCAGHVGISPEMLDAPEWSP